MTYRNIVSVKWACHREDRSKSGDMRIADWEGIEKVLPRLGLWEQGVRVNIGTNPPGEPEVEPWLDDPFPDYDVELVLKYENC